MKCFAKNNHYLSKNQKPRALHAPFYDNNSNNIKFAENKACLAYFPYKVKH